MKRTQRGVTFIGWILLLIPVAIVGYAGVRLIPIYSNYFSISRSMSQLAQAASGGDTLQSLHTSLGDRLNVNQVSFPDEKDFVIRRDGRSWVIEVEYEDGAPLFSNVSITAKFQKTVRVGDKPE